MVSLLNCTCRVDFQISPSPETKGFNKKAVILIGIMMITQIVN